ncbi:MAG: glycoside hydrolase family 20 zincin-like fold domain-containing protein [Flavobacteriaceae bacterium]
MRYLCFFIFILIISCNTGLQVTIVVDESQPRHVFGADKLQEALHEKGFQVERAAQIPDDETGHVVVLSENKNLTQKESFKIHTINNSIYVEGADASGALYGALKLTDMVREGGTLPQEIDLQDAPEMVLRGTVIGVQKMEYLPGRAVYEYPYTPENFPWFYNKELWIDYLDMMVENRYNSLYLWNGHPFASLVKLKDYPFAVEVSDEDFKKNEAIFKFITEEANKRGIWVIQMFYNIMVSKPFAEHYNIKTQDRSRPIVPLIADYTQKSIAAFVEKYPNVGLLVALGEAMEREYDVEWFTQTIIPGVKDGLKALGTTTEPPIILRAHDTDAPLVMEKALPLYQNLYTMHKYNGESLTTYQPRGPWSEIHQQLSAAGSTHISNVHVLANLEPFRFGSPDFIQKSVLAMHNVHGANALHLYPQTSYWDWPYAPDKTEPRLLEMERDWIWYKAWARYAWESNRQRTDEINFWGETLAKKYGTNLQAGEHILAAYEESGEIAPKTLRRFGITEGNRQTLLLGMFESQLVNPYKWRVYPGFYESCGPVGEILLEYAKKEWEQQPHEGETPLQIITEIVQHGQKAVAAIDLAATHVTKDQAEFERLKNDVYCYNDFANFFSEKVKAAILVLRYSYSSDIADLNEALPHLEKSITYYQDLVNRTKDTYLYANSMQTSQRRIPIGGDDGNNKTWEELLPHYERELTNFKRNIERLKISKDGKISKPNIEPWQSVNVEMLGSFTKNYTMQNGTKVYGTDVSEIMALAPELQNLKGIVLSEQEQIANGVHLKFKTNKPVKLVVGYFNTDQKRYLFPPSLETNAAGNARGEAEVVLANALKLKGLPRVNIHTYAFQSGENELVLGKGRVLLLGFIDANQTITSRDVGLIDKDEKEAVDWLFY